MTGVFEIVSIDLDKKRIGVALVPEGSARAVNAPGSQSGVTAAVESDDARDVREYSERQDGAAAGGFGSLADKLRGVLKPRE
jgi:hypothetical protein